MVNAEGKETAVPRSERGFRIAAAAIVLCAAAAFLSWGVTRGVAQDQEPVGRYQVAVPDLILDTATGRLVNSKGQVLEQAADPSGDEVGRYSVDGYVTAVTRYIGLDVLQQPTMRVDLVKGYVLADTKTGRVVKQRVYHSQPLQEGDL